MLDTTRLAEALGAEARQRADDAFDAQHAMAAEQDKAVRNIVAVERARWAALRAREGRVGDLNDEEPDLPWVASPRAAAGGRTFASTEDDGEDEARPQGWLT